MQDEFRVNKKFAQAAYKGLSIRKASLTDADLQHHLLECGPIILLTNANLLRCNICNGSRSFSDELRACLPWRSGNSSENDSVEYHGHYIVLCGYNSAEQSYMYRNPTYKDSKFVPQFTSYSCFLCIGVFLQTNNLYNLWVIVCILSQNFAQ